MILSIIIPVYNEEKTIAKLLNKVLKVKLPKGMKKEIIIIDDGSTDKTKKVLSEFKISRASLFVNKNVENLKLKILKHNKNQGKGAAIRTGIKHISGNIVIMQDADLEYNPDDFSRLLRPIIMGRSNVVYGSRLINYPLKLFGKDKTPLPTHWIGNKILTFMVNCLYQCNLTDMETCYKLFSVKVLENLNLKSARFEIEPEITAKIVKKGFNIIEIPIKVKPRTHKDGKKISWKDGIIALWTIVYYRFFD